MTSNIDLTMAAKAWRKARGLGADQIDHIADLQDGYSWKLEAPWSNNGRDIMAITFAGQCYLDAMGLSLVLMPRDMADRLCSGASDHDVTPSPRQNPTQARRVTRATVSVQIRG